jgi:hypothetical protein
MALEEMGKAGYCAYTKEMLGHIDFLADTLLRIGEQIEEEGNKVRDLLRAATADQEANHG